jgi:uncharacterized protein
MKPILVIYHANCQDGFAAAAVAHAYFHEIRGTEALITSVPTPTITRSGNSQLGPIIYAACQYGTKLADLLEEVGNVAGVYVGPTLDVYILDFSFPPEELSILATVNKIVILDHHATAKANFKGENTPYRDYRFDMERCGAMLTWDYFQNTMNGFHIDVGEEIKQEIPPMLKYIQDRDLWKWELENSRAISAWLALQERSLAMWSTWMTDHSMPLGCVTQGELILRYQDRMVESLAKKAVPHILKRSAERTCVRAVNSPVLQSEIGDTILKSYPDEIAAIFFYNMEKMEYIWSLRSKHGQARAIAELFGGGGHDNAAGFRTKTING